MTALECQGLTAGYASGRAVVRDLDLVVAPGQVLALLGPNGAGKTTVMLTLAGLLPRLAGSVRVHGNALESGRPATACRQGLVLVPDDRSLFTGLTVRQNLTLARRRGGTTLEQLLEWFPALGHRLDVAAGVLSGGEQQQVALARALVQSPKVLLVDELSMGLAPAIVEELLPALRHIALTTGCSVVLVEQHVTLALGVADVAVVLAHGEKVLEGSAQSLRADPAQLERAYLGQPQERSA